MDSLTKILLAEDEAALGQIVKESLETKGFTVHLCPDGAVALETYYKEKPQLLILDVMMPKKDGFTLAREIRMQDAHIPIIFLTAKSQTQDVVEGFTLGGNDYLKKPFSMEELIVRIKNLLQTNQQGEALEMSIGHYQFLFKQQTLQYKKEEIISLT
ncbi:MAG: response regulator transcription factor, partial [Flavobacteriaceae bacterium]|nr:response regulator transcription factor [Flavobacteriaceae bacterium]